MDIQSLVWQISNLDLDSAIKFCWRELCCHVAPEPGHTNRDMSLDTIWHVVCEAEWGERESVTCTSITGGEKQPANTGALSSQLWNSAQRVNINTRHWEGNRLGTSCQSALPRRLAWNYCSGRNMIVILELNSDCSNFLVRSTYVYGREWSHLKSFAFIERKVETWLSSWSNAEIGFSREARRRT